MSADPSEEPLTNLQDQTKKRKNIVKSNRLKIIIGLCIIFTLLIGGLIIGLTIKAKNNQSQNKPLQWVKSGVTVAGRFGTGNESNQLNGLQDIYVDGDQTIYVLDFNNSRIMKWKKDANRGEIVLGWNGEGNQTDQLSYPTGMIVDKENDRLIVCDNDTSRVVQWSLQNLTSGKTIMSNIDCYSVVKDNDGYLYMSDVTNHTVRRWKIGDENGTIVAGGNNQGNQTNQLDKPYYIFVDEEYSVYVSDSNNHRVMKWTKNATEGKIVAGGRGPGSSMQQLFYPRGIIVDHSGTIYVADASNSRVMRWLKGAEEGSIVVGGEMGGQPNQLSWPIDLSFDRQNNLYVVDHNNDRVQKFNVETN